MSTTADPVDRPIWPGTSGPASGSPERVPGSVRRTSSIDILHDLGAAQITLVGRGRDIRTEPDGTVTVLATASCTTTIDMVGRTVVSLDVEPVEWEEPLQALVGASTGFRFRAALAAAAPELAHDGSLLGLLLDDVPAAALISGAALVRQGLLPRMEVRAPGRARLPTIDICAGWVDGGAMVQSVEQGGSPMVAEGPIVCSLLVDDDADAWHELAPLPVGSMRRQRRIDVLPGDPHPIDVLFRDSYVEPDGQVSGVHEYGITATLDGSGTLLAIEADAHVLPAPDCPMAVASALRLVGLDVTTLRDHIHQTFTGTSTCTHLNDALRSMGDLHALVGLAES